LRPQLLFDGFLLADGEKDKHFACRATFPVRQKAVARLAALVFAPAEDGKHFSLRVYATEGNAMIYVELLMSIKINRIEVKEPARHANFDSD
jgi:hypothetical protein